VLFDRKRGAVLGLDIISEPKGEAGRRK
jgi:hypothetical protein